MLLYYVDNLPKGVTGPTKTLYKRLNEKEKIDLGGRCFIQVVFYSPAVEARTKYHAAPKLDLYRRLGANVLMSAGMHALAYNFNSWENHTREKLADSFNENPDINALLLKI